MLRGACQLRGTQSGTLSTETPRSSGGRGCWRERLGSVRAARWPGRWWPCRFPDARTQVVGMDWAQLTCAGLRYHCPPALHLLRDPAPRGWVSDLCVPAHAHLLE